MSTLTAREIYARQAKQTLALYLFNPKDEPAAGKHNGVDYVIPPSKETFLKVKKGRVVDQWDEPGVLPIRGYSYTYREFPNSEPKLINVTPEEIIDHLVGPDRMSGQLGAAGVRLLTGNPEEDEIIKADARQAWLRKQYEDDVVLTTAHEQVIATATATGRPIPFLSPRVRKAMQRRAQYESSGGELAAKYVCPKCGDRIKDDQGIRAHVQAYHPMHAADVLEKLKVPEVTTNAAPLQSDEEFQQLPNDAAPVRRGPGRPRKNAEA